jgi:dihydrofolate reductase
MSEIVVQEFITRDGVIQGGGGPDEDRDGGFALGGWAMEGGDDAEGDALVAEWESRTAALLLGRRTYEIWAGAWGVWSEDEPGTMGEFTRRYNRVTKHVASRTLTELSWRNSRLLGDDVPAAVAALRAEPLDGEIRVWGSANLVQTLAAHDLVDEYRLIEYPIVLGTGKRLFPEGFPTTRFDRVDVRVLASGATVTVLRPRRS